MTDKKFELMGAGNRFLGALRKVNNGETEGKRV